MALLKEWKDLLTGQDELTVKAFWEEYSEAEIKIYKDILANNKKIVEGTFAELASSYETRNVIFMGFLDGIETSLKNTLALETVTPDSNIRLEIDLELLFLNMLKVPAEHLYTLKEWDNVLSEERRMEITKEFKSSKTVVKEKKVGRNEPCPCGSGKKYKHCCGK